MVLLIHLFAILFLLLGLNGVVIHFRLPFMYGGARRTRARVNGILPTVLAPAPWLLFSLFTYVLAGLQGLATVVGVIGCIALLIWWFRIWSQLPVKTTRYLVPPLIQILLFVGITVWGQHLFAPIQATAVETSKPYPPLAVLVDGKSPHTRQLENLQRQLEGALGTSKSELQQLPAQITETDRQREQIDYQLKSNQLSEGARTELLQESRGLSQRASTLRLRERELEQGIIPVLQSRLNAIRFALQQEREDRLDPQLYKDLLQTAHALDQDDPNALTLLGQLELHEQETPTDEAIVLQGSHSVNAKGEEVITFRTAEPNPRHEEEWARLFTIPSPQKNTRQIVLRFAPDAPFPLQVTRLKVEGNPVIHIHGPQGAIPLRTFLKAPIQSTTTFLLLVPSSPRPLQLSLSVDAQGTTYLLEETIHAL